MEQQFNPRANRPASPLKSPLLRRHFAPIETNIHYPGEFFTAKPVYKQFLIGQDGNFKAGVDVHDYKPEEIKVKTMGHTIVIEMSHGEKDDEFGIIARNYSKKFILPPNMDMEKISSWTSQGVLYLMVPPIDNEKAERVVEIKHEA